MIVYLRDEENYTSLLATRSRLGRFQDRDVLLQKALVESRKHFEVGSSDLSAKYGPLTLDANRT
jgi:hypothetical protein